MESGYVRYYKDPRKHPKRQYIGVALEKEHTLPYPPNAVRRRRLNMLPVAITAPTNPAADAVVVADLTVAGSVKDTPREATRKGLTLTVGKGYAYREANWQIGRAAERAGVQVKEFVPGDRWTAWRKSNARIQANVEKKRLRSSGKKTAKPKARKARA
jgi:large subunit ribosomal protein L27